MGSGCTHGKGDLPRGGVGLENFRLAVTYLQFKIQACFLAKVSHLSSC